MTVCLFYPSQISPITTYPWIAAQSPRTYDLQSDNLVYLGPEEQGEIKRDKSNDIRMYAHCSLPLSVLAHVTEALPYNIIPLLKWNHFGRKNVGFLYAMHHGAEVIYDTDDDNILKVGMGGEPFIPDFSLSDLALSKDIIHSGQSHVYNPYPSFESVNVKDGSPAFVWPRGFPVDLITEESTWNLRRGVEESTQKGLITIVQSLADHDPPSGACSSPSRSMEEYRIFGALTSRGESCGKQDNAWLLLHLL